MSEIKPALTPEEWASRDRQDVCIDHAGRIAISSEVWMDNSDGDAYRVSVTATIDDVEGRHAIAAFALHGQPFGFTWEDVRRLRELDGHWESRDGGPLAPATWPGALADRIAALLPPRG